MLLARPPLADLEELNCYEQRIPLTVLQQWLEKAALGLEQVRPFLRFGAEHYVRNLMYAGPAYQALVLCWRGGQRSPIHDHVGSACGVRVIQGVATETSFARSETGLLFATGSSHLAAGEICARQDDDVHQMSNLRAGDLVTLHIYSPPLLCMNMYSISHTQVCQFVDPINAEFVSGAGI